MISQYSQTVFTLGLAFLVSACATHTVKTTSFTPVVQDSQDVPEDFLLDVGVSLFDPGIDEYLGDDEDTANPEIRVAESRYAPYLLAETLQRSANWGIVRVMPNSESPMDVQVDGTILRSNGEAMIIRVEVNDSRGRNWYTKEYEEVISQFSYDTQNRQRNDPFQVIYNKIANDLLAYRQRNIEALEVQEIRTVSELLFAQRFSDDAFGDYLARDRNGEYQLTALPADNDPLLDRIRSIRERDFMFIDTVQDYYATYVRQMRLPYDTWREQSYEATVELREVEAAARRRFIAGAAAVIGGVAAASNSGTWVGQASGAATVGVGAGLIRAGINKREEAQMRAQDLAELGESLENEVAPRVLDLDDRTITLSGTVSEQYEQWRDILKELYAAEMGEL